MNKLTVPLSFIVFLGASMVHAAKMTRQEYNDKQGWTLPDNEDGTDIGYLIADHDGQASEADFSEYVTWLPESVFQQKYRQNGELEFGDALYAMKLGKKVARSGWNGKDQYVVAQQGQEIESTYVWNPHNKAHAEMLGGWIEVAPYCTLKTAQDTLAMGWTPSTGDLFANDWMIVE